MLTAFVMREIVQFKEHLKRKRLINQLLLDFQVPFKKICYMDINSLSMQKQQIFPSVLYTRRFESFRLHILYIDKNTLGKSRFIVSIFIYNWRNISSIHILEVNEWVPSFLEEYWFIMHIRNTL